MFLEFGRTNEILVASDYEKIGSIYYFDEAKQTWFGHWRSKSSWVIGIKAPVILQHELTKQALSMGYEYERLRPAPKIEPKAEKKEKEKSVTNKSPTFTSLF